MKSTNYHTRARTVRSLASFALLLGSLSMASAQGNESKSGISDSETVDLSPFITKGQRISFREEDASSAMLVSVPIKETPFNVSVITDDLIDDLQVDSLHEATLLDAGVTRTHSHTKNAVNFSIRGFAMDADRAGYLVNGVPVSSFDAPPAHTSALDRIEILKGSAALYYGAGEPAGVVNYLYKQPLSFDKYSVKTTLGSYDKKSAELDATGPLADSLQYRFTLGWQDSQGVVDYDYSKDFAPTLQLAWQPTENTNIRFIGEHVKHEGNPISSDTIWLDGAFLEADKSQYLGFSTDYEEQENNGIQIHLDHDFSNHFRLKAQGGYKDGTREGGNSGYLAILPFTIPGFSDAANGIAPRSAFDQKRSSETEYIAAHAVFDLGTDEISHNIVAGFNYSNTTMNNIGNFNSSISLLPQILGAVFSGQDPSPLLATLPPSVNIFNPVTVAYDHATNFEDSPPFYRDIWSYQDLGFNIQDKIDFDSLNLHLLLGFRYTESKAESFLSIDEFGVDNTGTNRNTADESAWLPRVGVVYDLNENHSLFASYSESFKPPYANSRDVDGNPITTPENSSQYELGWRASFLEGRLSSSLAAYELTKSDIIVATGLPDISTVAGEQKSQGLELSLTGKVTDKWDLYLSYAYTDTKVVDGGNTGQAPGERFASIPLNRLVVWNNFSLDWLGVEGLNFGYGLDYMDSTDTSAITDLATLTLGTVAGPVQGAIHSANISYSKDTEWGGLEFTLGVKNFTDKFYVLNSSNTIFAKRGEPRTVELTTMLSF